MLELVPHLLEHAFEDTIYLVPFLLVTYFLLEALEHKAGNRTEELVQKAGKLGPAVAAVLGAVPQCGFSAAGAALFSSRAITLGTLFAVLLSTSDEMLPLFIAEQVDWRVMASIVGVKVVIGMIMGLRNRRSSTSSPSPCPNQSNARACSRTCPFLQLRA